MPRFRVIREATRQRVDDPWSEVSWWVIDDATAAGHLTLTSRLDSERAERDLWLEDARTIWPTDRIIFDHLAERGGNRYFRNLSLPETHTAASRQALIDALTCAGDRYGRTRLAS